MEANPVNQTDIQPQQNTGFLIDENIFSWEYLVSINQEPQSNQEDHEQYQSYKNLKQRYVYEVTNWFQTPLQNQQITKSLDPRNIQQMNGSYRDTSIPQIENYVNGKIPMGTMNMMPRWISIRWASLRAFSKFYVDDNGGSFEGQNFLILTRKKKAYFEFKCPNCNHVWSTQYGTFKFYLAFKKDLNGLLMEDEIFVRIKAYKQDCINCGNMSEASGIFTFNGSQLENEHIAKKFIEMAAFSIGNTILRQLGYLEGHQYRGYKGKQHQLQEKHHQSSGCGACIFNDCLWQQSNQGKK